LKHFLSLLSSITKASKNNYHLIDLLLSSTPSWWKMHWHLLSLLWCGENSSDDIATWSYFSIFFWWYCDVIVLRYLCYDMKSWESFP
jgi:hypothetical protein